MITHPSTILITGASNGLGAALARIYALPGSLLFLSGRNRERLEAVAEICRARGAQVHMQIMDVKNRDAMAEWVTGCDRARPIDLVIANAGISGGTGTKQPRAGGMHPTETEAQTREIFDTNVNGVLNTVLPIIPAMVSRRRGQIALISSLSAMRGLPSAPAYSASKAAVKHYGEALRGMLSKAGVKVNVVCPGYIKTQMTEANDFPMPFIMSADKAADIIARGLARNRSRIAFPLRLHVPLWILSCLSPGLTDRFFAALPAKSARD